MSGLEQRIRRLEDRWELSDLVHEYGVAVDGRDMDALAQMFVRDAALAHTDGVEAGRDAVMAYYRRRLGEYTTTYHYAHTQAVRFGAGDNEASGVVTAHAELSIGGEAVWIALRYNDEYVREDGRWRFRSRRQEFVYVLPLRELPSSIGDTLRKRWPGTAPAPAELPDGLETYRRFAESAQRRR